MHLFGVVQAHRTSSNLPEPHHYRDSKVCRVLSHEFVVVRPYRTVSVWCAGCLCTSSGVFQAHRTSSNLPEPHHYRDSKVCRVLSHEFGVVRPYRTFSVYIVTGETRSAGCLCTSSGWFKHIEPPRTFSNHIITKIARCVEFCHMSSGCFKHIEPRRTFPNHIITEIAKCVEFCHMSSGWLDCTEPSLSTSLHGQQGMQGVVHLFGVVQAHRTSSNLLEPYHYKDSKVYRVLSHQFGVVRLYRTFSIYIVAGETRCAGWLCTSSGWFKHIEPHHYRDSKVCRVLSHEFGVFRPYQTVSVWCAGCLCTSSGWFKHIEPRRTFPNHIIIEIAKCVEFCHMSSGWFDCTETSLSTSLQGKQGVQGAYALVRGGSSTSNLVEPSRTTSLQR